MKRGKKLLTLLIALAVLSAAAVLVVKFGGGSGDETEEYTDTVIYSVDTGSVSNITWTYNGETVGLSLSDDGWVYDEDDACPIDQDYPSMMLSYLSSVSASKTIENVDDLSEYGLDEPACSVTVTADETTQLLIGNETGLGGEYYLSLGDGNVYLVDDGVLDYFHYGLYDVVQTESIPSMSDVTGFTVNGETRNLELEYIEDSGIAYSDTFTWFLADGDGRLAVSNDSAENFIGLITGLSWSACVDYSADDDELAAYGLDEPAAVVTVNYIETVTVETSETDENGSAVTEERRQDASFTLEIGDYSSIDGYCYARISGSGMVYLISSDICDSMLYTGYDDLRSDDVLDMDWSKVTRIDVVLDGVTWHIDRGTEEVTDDDGNTTEETYYEMNGERLDTAAVASLLSSLQNMSSVASDDNASASRGSEITFIIHQDSESWPEVELVFYQYDSSYCLVGLNGETRLFVERSEVVSIVEAANAIFLGDESEAAEETDSSVDG